MNADPPSTPAADSDRLEEIARDYDPSDQTRHFDYWLKRLQTKSITPWLRGRNTLELGCATGELTSLLEPLVARYDVVEGSQHNIDVASARVPGANFTLSMWEDFEPQRAYSDIVLCNAIEHVSDPASLLVRVRDWLEPDGRVHIVVPNGYSLHRLVGVEMGFLPEPLFLSPGDVAQGHVRNYTVDTLLAEIRGSGMRVANLQPVFLKLLSNPQMLGWEWSLIEAIHNVAQRFPEHGAEIYAVAERA